jgi:hypothetical protein
MRCEDCRGVGSMRVMPPWRPIEDPFRDPRVIDTARLLEPPPITVPCPSCGGTGTASCCEGAVGLAGDVTNG